MLQRIEDLRGFAVAASIARAGAGQTITIGDHFPFHRVHSTPTLDAERMRAWALAWNSQFEGA